MNLSNESRKRLASRAKIGDQLANLILRYEPNIRSPDPHPGLVFRYRQLLDTRLREEVLKQLAPPQPYHGRSTKVP